MGPHLSFCLGPPFLPLAAAAWQLKTSGVCPALERCKVLSLEHARGALTSSESPTEYDILSHGALGGRERGNDELRLFKHEPQREGNRVRQLYFLWEFSLPAPVLCPLSSGVSLQER